MTAFVVVEALGIVDTWYVCKGSEDGPVIWEERTKAAAERARVRLERTGSAFETEPTPIGNQHVIPGCERDKSRGPKQMDLF